MTGKEIKNAVLEHCRFSEVPLDARIVEVYDEVFGPVIISVGVSKETDPETGRLRYVWNLFAGPIPDGHGMTTEYINIPGQGKGTDPLPDDVADEMAKAWNALTGKGGVV